MPHKNGECFAYGNGITPCICCVWTSVREGGRSTYTLDLHYDFNQAFNWARNWTRGVAEGWGDAVTAPTLKEMLRGLRFSRLMFGFAAVSGQDGYYASLTHEGGNVIDGFGLTVVDALAEALRRYIAQVEGRLPASV